MNLIFYKEKRAIGFINIILLFGLTFFLAFQLFQGYLIALVISLLLSFLLFLLLNKKWFNKIYLYDNYLLIEFFFNFFGKKKIKWQYSQIMKITYYEYMSKTPAHCKIQFEKEEIYRFNCDKKEFNKLIIFLNKKKINVEFYNKETNKLRK
jgi:hypothetical protein